MTPLDPHSTIPHDLGPLRASHEDGDVEAGLKAAFLAVFEDMIRPRLAKIGVYGAPHRGDFDVLERFVKADGLALDRQDAREPYMRELFRAWKSHNPRRGLHFLRHYLRLLYPGTSSVYQLWWNPSDPYPVGSAAEIPGGVLTSRVRVTVPGSSEMSSADLLRLRGILMSILPARMVMEMYVTVGAGFESFTSIVAAAGLTEIAAWAGTAEPAGAMLSVSDIVVDDTDGNAVFTVTLNSIQSGAVSVSYATSDGTATAPSDYTDTSGTLTITAGNLSGTVSVPIVANTSAEGDQSFTLTLSSPSGATISDGSATCTITDTYSASAGHRYWRWTGFAWSGDRVEISELRVVNGSTPIAADMTSSSSPSYYGLYYLTDGSFGSGCTWWSPAGLWIVADLGSAQEVTGMQVGAVSDPGSYPTDITLQWSDDNSSWTTFGTWSGLTYPGNNTAGPVLTPPAHVTDGLVFMLDPEAYSSGQVWGTAPYDFNLGSGSGADGADPTHNGTYWTFDGGDYFTAASAATAFIKNMHKAGSEWTIEAWWYSTGSGGNVNPIFDSGTVDGGGPDMSRGVIFGDQGSQINPESRWGVRVMQDSGGVPSLNAYLSTGPAADAWHHHAVSFTGGSGCFLWLDGAVAASNLGATTWDGTLSSPGTTDTANPARIGARGDVAFRVASGSRIGALRVYDRALSQAELLQNWNAERATYGL